MSDFDDGRAAHALDQFGNTIRNTIDAISILQGQVAALTAYIAHLGLVVKDEDILAIKGVAQKAAQHISSPFGTTPPARYASEYVDVIHAAARQATAGNEGPHG
jgi:hypothetical protein